MNVFDFGEGNRMLPMKSWRTFHPWVFSCFLFLRHLRHITDILCGLHRLVALCPVNMFLPCFIHWPRVPSSATICQQFHKFFYTFRLVRKLREGLCTYVTTQAGRRSLIDSIMRKKLKDFLRTTWWLIGKHCCVTARRSRLFPCLLLGAC